MLAAKLAWRQSGTAPLAELRMPDSPPLNVFWPVWKRRLVSGLLLFHVLSVVLGWLAVFNEPLQTVASPMLGWYQTPLWLDLDRWTNWQLADEPDASILLIQPVSANSQPGQQSGRTTPADLAARAWRGGENQHRLRRLAIQGCENAAAEAEAFSATIPKAVARNWLAGRLPADHLGGAGQIEFQLHDPRPLGELIPLLAQGETVDPADPLFRRTQYLASITVFDGQLELIRLDNKEARQSSPAATNPSAPQARPNP